MRARALTNMESIEGDTIHEMYEYEVCINIHGDDSVTLHVNNDGVIDTLKYDTRNDMYSNWKFGRTSTRRMTVSEVFMP